MQPFRITCETCRSRLKIRSADVIGQIHACPKCGSMVQVVPPAGWDAAAMAGDQPSAPGEAALTLSTTASVIIPAGALEDLAAAAAGLEAPAVEVPVETAPALVLPPAKAGSPVLMWALGGVAAVFLVGGLAWAVWPRGGDDAKPQAAAAVAKQSDELKPTTPPVEPSKAKASDADGTHPKSDVAQVAQTEKPKPASEPVVVEPVKVAKQADPAPSTPSPVVVKADPPKVAIAEPAPTNVAPPHLSKPAEPAPAAPDHSPVLKFDPLDFDIDRLGTNTKPSTASTSSIPNKAPGEPAANGVAGNDAAPADVVVDQGKQPAAGDATPRPVVNNGVSVRRGPPRDAPQRVIGQVLAARVKSIQVAEMPLARFIEIMSGVASTGITLDPIALEQVGISPQATVSVTADDTPLQSILHDALGQRRLDIAEQGGQLRIALPKGDEPHAIDYDVKDLTAGKDAVAVGKLIEKFVAPATWKTAGGKGTLQASGTSLHIEQSDAVRRQVVIFCERLRLARGLMVQSKYPAAMLSIEPAYQRLSTKLSGHTTFTFLPWTRLDDVVRNWQELSGLTVLVDWSALSEAELGPSSLVACSANDRSWQEALDGVLEPLGLGWWAVNGEMIQITSLTALDRVQRIEFYQVPPKVRGSFASNQALVESLRKELSDAVGKSDKPIQAHVELDEASGRLIVLSTPSAHRHLSQRLGGSAKQ